MYGLGNLIGNMFTGAVTPAIGSAITEATRGGISEAASGLFSHKVADTLGKIGGTALGTLAGAGVGAGLGALTEGKYGAYGGALTGGMGGGWGGIKSAEIQKSLGFGPSTEAGITTPQTQAGIGAAIQKGFPAMQMEGSGLTVSKPAGDYTSGIGGSLNKYYPETPEVGTALTDITTQKLPSTDMLGQGPLGIGRDKYGVDITKYEVNTPDTQTTQAETPQAKPTDTSSINLGDYMDIAGKSFMPSVTAGTGLTANLVQQYWASEAQKKAQAEEEAKQKQLQEWAAALYPQYYADGGPVQVQVDSPAGPVTAKYPEWFVDDYIKSGGVGGLLKSFANGGYLNNTLPVQEDQHPQSLIPKAQPHPGAAPVRQEVVQTYEHGGLLNGDGDGMSDSIPAEIDGKEPVRVADGEYVVPKHIAEAKQAELKRMMSKVRSAAHPKKGQQIKQDAAKRAFIQTMSGVKA